MMNKFLDFQQQTMNNFLEFNQKMGIQSETNNHTGNHTGTEKDTELPLSSTTFVSPVAKLTSLEEAESTINITVTGTTGDNQQKKNKTMSTNKINYLLISERENSCYSNINK
jgi:hypothetical protein